MAIPGTYIPQVPPVAPPVPSPGTAQAPLPTAGGGAQLDWLRQLLGGQQGQPGQLPAFQPNWLQQYIVKRKRARFGPSWQPPAAEPADVTAPGFADPGQFGQFGQGTAFQWLNNRLRA